jgi:ferredoxin
MSRVVVLDNCEHCGDCVEVCPMQCFHNAAKHMAINIEECVDCALCEDTCQNAAITSRENNEVAYRKFVRLNLELSAKYPKAF